MRFVAKVPDSFQETRSVDMEFHYRSSFRGEALPEAYERLLLDAMQGDAALFARSDEIDTAWKLIDPVIQGWEPSQLATYEAGGPGPGEADELLSREGRVWRPLSIAHRNG